jgi:hypothetical protein
MRLLVSVVAVAGVGRVAAAEPSYPESDVDRPLLLYSGMTSLDLGLDLPTYVHFDTSGNATKSNTALGRYRNADVVLSHSFGNIEVGARILGDPSGPYAQARAIAYLGPIPGALSMTAQIKAPSSDSVADHEYTEGVGYMYKLAIVPHQLAVLAAANVSVSELGLKPIAMSPPAPPSGTYVYAGIGLTAEVQLAAPFAIAVGAGLSGPIRQPHELGTGSAALETSMSLLYALHEWDFYCQPGLTDITSSRRPFVNFGAVHAGAASALGTRRSELHVNGCATR